MNIKRHIVNACFLTLFSCVATINAWGGEAPVTPTQDATTYFRIAAASIEALNGQVSIESQRLLEQVQPEVELEGYLSLLRASDYAAMLQEYLRGLTVAELQEAVSSEFAPFYTMFIDRISDEQFAEIYRQYLGELTSDYLTSASSRDFTQYVLSRILELTEEDYAGLYRDYVETLWRYYVASTPEEDLRALLGADYAALTSTDRMAVHDESYFATLTEHITTLAESEFAADYRTYVTEVIGGVLSGFNSPVPSEAVDHPAPEVTDGADTDEAETAEPQVQAMPTPMPGLARSFSALTPEESLALLRRHIASIAKSYFIIPFQRNFVATPVEYVRASSPELISQLMLLEGVQSIALRKMREYNASNRQLSAYAAELLDDGFLQRVKDALRLVANIPYPNERLLHIAITHALNPFRSEVQGDGQPLSDEQFQILLRATMNTIIEYNANGPVSGIAIGSAPSEGDAAVSSGDISWDFLGCGCEIDRSKVIYGFYPTWDVPAPGSGPQEIDFRFYDRVAYFGLTLDANGRISDDEYWREGGAMNDFIQGAHIRDTRIDLAVYSPDWPQWRDANINIAASNIVDKLTIPLHFGFFTRLAATYFVPVYPTSSETIGKSTMGDGLTLYFDNLEDPLTGEVRDLESIEQLVLNLNNIFATRFEGQVMPINLMLDFKRENTTQVLEEIRNLMVGTPDSPNQYLTRLLIFLEQDSWESSQILIDAVRNVFKDYDSAAMLRKINPILIPAMDKPGEFASLERDLLDLRWTFGEQGGAAIWPMPLQNLEEDLLIERAFRNAMVEESSGFWQDFRGEARRIYFRARLQFIFTLTGVFLLTMLVLGYSIREPVNPWVLRITKFLGFAAFVLFMLSALFIDPYINPWRIVFYVVSVILILLVPFQPALPDTSVGLSENKFVKRQLKRQKSKTTRRLRTFLRRGLFQRHGD
jgi:hypothetical protein